MSPRTLTRATIAACGLAAAAAAVARAQAPRPEVEPNNSKTEATPVTIGPADFITGASTGAAATAGPASADYFLVKTTPLAPGIYRHRLTLGATGHQAMIRGLMQNSGVITGNEAALQSTSVVAPFSMWYGFGREERLYYRVTGTASTTSPYSATLSTVPVTPAPVPTIPPGVTTITTVGRTGNPETDTDLWVYDDTFHPIPGFGNDEPNLETVGSTLTRTFAAGTYYLALTSHNLANDQPSPPDDYYLFGSVTDFPDVALNSDEEAPLNVGFRITDSASVVRDVNATKSGALEIAWFKLDVRTPPPPCYVNCDHSTSPPALNILDFNCFLLKFVQEDSYANCDQSTTPPIFNIQDFNCFLLKFVVGCSIP